MLLHTALSLYLVLSNVRPIIVLHSLNFATQSETITTMTSNNIPYYRPIFGLTHRKSRSHLDVLSFSVNIYHTTIYKSNRNMQINHFKRVNSPLFDVFNLYIRNPNFQPNFRISNWKKTRPLLWKKEAHTILAIFSTKGGGLVFCC